MGGHAGVRDRAGGLRIGRRRFMAGLGAGGLTTAGLIFGFATPAQALVDAGCCTLYCNPSSNSLIQCETGHYYVWSCAYGSEYLICDCCEHGNPGINCPPPGKPGPCGGCNSSNYSSYQCQY